MIYKEAAVQRVMRAAHDDLDWRDVARNNDINFRSAYRWSPRKPRGGRRNAKIPEEHVDFLLNLLDDNCYLTLEEMVDELEPRFGLRESRQCLKKHIDGRMYTMKQTNRDNNYRNLPEDKILRRDYIVDLLAFKSEGKKIYYVDETNFNLWYSRRCGRSLKGKRAVDKNTASKGSNIHAFACIYEDGLAYSEKRFGSFNSEKCNELIRRLLMHIKRATPLGNMVLVADNAPCHSSIEEVFEEDAFADAEFLRLGPYSPMLNPIENWFSTFKSMVKRFLANHRPGILYVPPHRTIKAHREKYLKMAADLLVREATTLYLCYQSTR
ncbi:hypothetical protein PHMEG_00014101 [Phytophthora megakarya]|uniref:Tc1-like transposase DDE domain-containing protein n=1 Tax=Phytophthora megakarya TaxID=4795 RepID=A0A225W5Q8_9STRA|nr:hypothetical protein PHMEG_00014101 [Phytophthora megakarya]